MKKLEERRNQEGLNIMLILRIKLKIEDKCFSFETVRRISVT